MSKNKKIWKIWIDLWDFCPTGHSLSLFTEQSYQHVGKTE